MLKKYKSKLKNNLLKGKGIYDKTVNFFLGNRGNKLYDGEKHSVLYNNTTKKYQPAFFMGPGTNMIQRLKNNDDKKIFSKADKTSLAHDLRYYLSNELNDIRKADVKMVEKLKNIEKNKEDSKWNTLQGRLGIQSKMFLEDKLKVPKSFFTTFGDYKNDSIENQTIAQQKLNELEQEGYGIHRAKKYKKKVKKNKKKSAKRKRI